MRYCSELAGMIMHLVGICQGTLGNLQELSGIAKDYLKIGQEFQQTSELAMKWLLHYITWFTN